MNGCRGLSRALWVIGIGLGGLLLVSPGSGAADKPAGATRPTLIQPAANVAPAKTAGGLPEEFAKFATDFKVAAHSEDPKQYAALIDWDTVLTAAMAGIDLPEPSRTRIAREFQDQVAKTGGDFAARIVGELASGGRYDLVRFHLVDGKPRALFRMVGTEEGLEYHDVSLYRHADGKLRAGEILDLSAGETLSTIVRRSILPMAVNDSKDALNKLSTADHTFVANLHALQTVYSAIQEKNFAEALAQYGKLPAEVKRDRHLLLLRLRIAQSVDEKTAAATLADVRREIPSDACVDLNSLDWCMQRKDFPQARAAIARIEKAVEGDPFLNTIRARMLLDEGKTAEARRMFEETIAASPEIENAYWGLLEILVAEKKYAETAKLLKIVATRFDADLTTLAELPPYAEFVKTIQYRDLVRSLRK